MTRISYKKNDQGLMVTDPILTGHHSTVVSLNLESMQAIFINFDSTEVVKTMTHKTLHGLKKLVKAELKSYGAVFNDEVRRKTINLEKDSV